MSTQLLLWMVTAANALVAATTYALVGWNSAGAHAAARNTARFAGLCYLLAFAVPALGRLAKRLPSEPTLLLAFVAAQGVHFATVLVVLFEFDFGHVGQSPLRTTLVVAGGFGLVLTLALTAQPRTERWHTALRTFALYVVFLIFLVGFGFDQVKPLRALSVVFLTVLIARLTLRFQSRPRVAADGTSLAP